MTFWTFPEVWRLSNRSMVSSISISILAFEGVRLRQERIGKRGGCIDRLLHRALVNQDFDRLLPALVGHPTEPAGLGLAAEERRFDVGLELLDQHVALRRIFRIGAHDDVGGLARVLSDIG